MGKDIDSADHEVAGGPALSSLSFAFPRLFGDRLWHLKKSSSSSRNSV